MRGSHTRRSMTWCCIALMHGGLLAAGCDPLDLTTPSEVVRLRVLAIEAQPAELAYGDQVTLTPVVADPWNEGYSVQWMPCIEAQLAGFVACDFENMLVDLADPFGFLDLSSEELTFTVDQQVVYDLMAERDPMDRAEGVPLQFILMLLPRGKTFLDYMPEFDTERLDDPAYIEEYGEQAGEALNEVFEALMRQSRIAFKRVIVSDLDSVGIAPHATGDCADLTGLLPNEAPRPGGIVTVEEELETALPSGATIPVVAGEGIGLLPLWNPDDQESYYHVAWGGETECRTEQPFFGWYATAGGFSDVDGFPADNSYLEEEGFPEPVQWRAPSTVPQRNPVDAWLVVWDRRGGIGHVEFRLEVVEGLSEP